MLLPLEILFLVIDAVSTERRTIKTFSLVSRSFHSRARVHLFSQVTLWLGMGPSCRRGAVEFLRILKYKKNLNLLSRIMRSVKIFLHPPDVNGLSMDRHPYYPEPDDYPLDFNSLLKLMGVDTDPIKTALAVFKNAPIEELTLITLDHKILDNRISNLLLEICSNPISKL
ncbi:hypothetical protein M413DRAFT_31894 [Hebeloma cylindrosporum]|uniref:F-box domain-containing protein n=1 Tax=Hebeloma cylindrosporum TaxID=76867 RepID=A0A0C2Y524_HEBCY|nr:hypothetical protein M413DRAFT_31894 [Hebeloma cylindrosporum h7]